MISFSKIQAARDFCTEIKSGEKTIGSFELRDISEDFYEDRYEMIIDLDNGYSELLDEVLKYALEQAFEEIGAASVHCVVNSYDTTALYAYFYAGFIADSENAHITQLSITVKQYYKA